MFFLSAVMLVLIHTAMPIWIIVMLIKVPHSLDIFFRRNVTWADALAGAIFLPLLFLCPISCKIVLTGISMLWGISIVRGTPGALTIGIGGLSNFLAVVSNGGHMPVRDTRGPTLGLHEGIHSLMDSTTRLPWLCDIFYAELGKTFQAWYSIGDILITTGAFWMIGTVLYARRT